MPKLLQGLRIRHNLKGFRSRLICFEYESQYPGSAAQPLNGFPAPALSATVHAIPEFSREMFDQLLISRSGQSPARAAVLPIAGEVARGEFFAALLVLGCVNGLGSQIIRAVNEFGWAGALADTFGVSAIVWLSCIAGISIILRDRAGEVRSADLAVGAGFLFLVILPVGPLSWIAVTVLCLYVFVSTNDSLLRRGAIILLATTVPMFWSRMLFQLFATPILQADAILVAGLLGLDGSGTWSNLPTVLDFLSSSLFVLRSRMCLLHSCVGLLLAGLYATKSRFTICFGVLWPASR